MLFRQRAEQSVREMHIGEGNAAADARSTASFRNSDPSPLGSVIKS
jgi:hypothetical protein